MAVAALPDQSQLPSGIQRVRVPFEPRSLQRIVHFISGIPPPETVKNSAAIMEHGEIAARSQISPSVQHKPATAVVKPF